MANAAGLTDDGKLRTPMSWTTDTSNAGFTTGTPYRVLSGNVGHAECGQPKPPNRPRCSIFYRTMLALRNTRASIRDGAYVQPQVTGSVMSYQRQSAGETTLVVINYGTVPSSVDINGLAANASLHALYSATAFGDLATNAAGTLSFVAAAQSVLVFDVSPPL